MFSGWLVWALLASLVWGVGQVVAKKGLNLFTPLAFNFLFVPFDLLIYIPLALLLGADPSRITLFDLLLTIFTLTTYVLYSYVISMGELSLTGTIISSYPLSTMFFSVALLGEKLTMNQFIFILLIILGVVLIGLPEKLKGLKVEGWFGLAIITALLIGFGDFLAKIVIGRIGVANYFLIYGISYLPGLMISLALDKKGRRIPKISLKDWVSALIGASMVTGAGIFFFIALSKGPASLVAPVASSYTALTVILALIFLKEKLRKIQAFGVLLVVLGIILIGS